MENNKLKNAFPFHYSCENGDSTHQDGLTKREYFALHLLSGLCIQAIPGSHNTCESQKRELVPHAIELADELLKKLEESNNE